MMQHVKIDGTVGLPYGGTIMMMIMMMILFLFYSSQNVWMGILNVLVSFSVGY